MSVFGQSPSVVSESEVEAAYQRLKSEEAATARQAEAERLARARDEADMVERKRAGERKVFTLEGVEYAFRYCPSGTFMMGSPTSEADRRDIEGVETQHPVTLTRGFWLLETEVTQLMWESVIGSNPSAFKGKNLPVERVSWDDSQEFIRKLNQLPKPIQGLKFALPTEAQWEYACRAGTTTPYYFGSDWRQLEEYGWYSGHKDFEEWENSKEYKDNTFSKWGFTTHAVGTKKANAWGLYDMHGNVWEWCSDWGDAYPSGSVTDPVGASTSSNRVYRGGSWGNCAGNCRSANRSGREPSVRVNRLGVRLSLVSD